MSISIRRLIPVLCIGTLVSILVYQLIARTVVQHHLKRGLIRNLLKKVLQSDFETPYYIKDNSSRYSAKLKTTLQSSYRNRTKSKNKKFIVYLCDRHQACGGWGDRQKGMISAFLLANVTNRKFLINMTSPCNLNQFLVPNEYNWQESGFSLDGKTSRIIGGVRVRDYQETIGNEDFNLAFPEDVVYLRTNADLLNTIRNNDLYQNEIPAWAKGRRQVAFKNAWNILFRPSVELEEEMNQLLTGIDLTLNDSLVCAHVRVGKNPDMPNDSPKRNEVASLPALWSFLKKYEDRAKKIFIATDSTSVRNVSRKMFGLKSLDTDGKILHIDRQRKREDACRGLRYAILDQLMLTKCRVLVVSGSNFSIRAAFIRGSNSNLFIFKNGVVQSFRLP